MDFPFWVSYESCTEWTLRTRGLPILLFAATEINHLGNGVGHAYTCQDEGEWK